MAYLGKTFTLDSQENFKEFVESFGDHVPPQAKEKILSGKPTLKLEKNGDEYTLTSSDRTITFKSGVTFDEEPMGNKCKTTITVNGDVLTQQQKFDIGVEFTIVREFSDSQVVATVESNKYNGPKAKRVYKA